MKKSLLLMLFLALTWAWTGVNAQKSLPYNYGFEDNDLATDGWTLQASSSSTGISTSAKKSGIYGFAFHYSEDPDAYLVSPVLDGTDKGVAVSFYYKNYSSSYVEEFQVGYTTDENATDPSSFTYGATVYGEDSWALYENVFPASTKKIAIKYIYTDAFYLYIDDFSFSAPPSCPKPSGLAVETSGLNASLTWISDGTSFDIAYAKDATANPEENIDGNTSLNTYSINNLDLDADYYLWVRARCGSDGESEWAGPVSAHIGYCVPGPTYRDGKGITGVAFGVSDVVNNSDATNGLPSASPYYGDYSAMVGAVQAGVVSTIAITTSTGSYPYTFVIWVDFDNDLTFEDDEIIYAGKCTSGAGILNANITIPATQATGDYRMRIAGADSYFTSFYNNGGELDYTKDHDPCLTGGKYVVFHDYTLRVLEAPSCVAPTALGAANITANSADLSWTANSGESEWRLFVKKASDENYAEVNGIITNPYTLSGLDPASEYQYYVIAKCGGSDESEASEVFSFMTACEAVTSFPWSEDFESYSAGDFAAPCWVNEHISGNGSKVFGISTTNAHGTSTKQLNLPDMTSGTMTKLMLPEFDLPNDNYQFVLDVYRNASGTSYTEEGIRVFASQDGEIEGAAELAFISRNYTQTDGNLIPAETASGWYTYELPIVGISGTCYIILRGESKFGSATYMDNFIVKEIPSCLKPTVLDADNITTNSADLSWTANSGESEWRLFVKKASDENYAEVNGIITNPYTLSGLDPASEYQYYVIAKCGGSDESEASEVFSFMTACEAVTSFPWSENFEGFSASSSGVKLEAPCWENIHLAGTGTYFFEVYSSTSAMGSNSTKMLRLHDMSDGTMTKLGLPEMTLPNDNYQFVLDVYRNATGTSYTQEGIRIFASTDGEIEGATELAFISRNYTQTDGKLIPAEEASGWYTYELPIGISGTCYIILRGESKFGSATYMDNFFVKEIPSCLKPTGLVVSNVAATSATLAWVAGGTETTWEICLNGDETNPIAVNANPYDLTGLTDGTNYSVKVRAACSDTDKSDWSLEISFATPQIAVNVPFSDDFENGNKWLLVNGNLTNAWALGEATSNGGTHSLYISNDGGETNAYTVNSAAMVYATKLFNFEAGKYAFSYDWKAKGEAGYSIYDYLRVALVPSTVELSAATSTPSGFTPSGLPSGWIALDGGEALVDEDSWQKKEVVIDVPAAGAYKMVLAWRDDTSSGDNPPAAIDNVHIVKVDSIHVNASRFATFYTENYAYIMPEGLTGYAFTVESHLSDAIYEADDIVPANAALVLESAKGDTTYWPVPTFVDVPNMSVTNDLHGVNEATIIGSATDGKAYYVLSLNGASEPESVGFYYMLEDGKGGFELPAHKAYLVVDNPSLAPAAFYLFNGENGATWLENLEGVEGTVKFMHEGNIYILRDSIIYDATGRKVRELK